MKIIAEVKASEKVFRRLLSFKDLVSHMNRLGRINNRPIPETILVEIVLNHLSDEEYKKGYDLMVEMLAELMKGMTIFVFEDLTWGVDQEEVLNSIELPDEIKRILKQ